LYYKLAQGYNQQLHGKNYLFIEYVNC